MPEVCVHCGGSGVLNVIAVYPISDGATWWDTGDQIRAVSCHACEMGAVMAEVGVDG